MDYEKKYKEALELMKDCIPDENGLVHIRPCDIFSELKEGERIRKDIVFYIAANHKDDGEKARWLYWLEKQAKQKPADKVEPKFHEGDWVVENEPNNYARFIQILEVVDIQGKERYRISRDLHNDEDVVECRFIENNYHLFNIKDAKDGDVLVVDNVIFIYKRTLASHIVSYCKLINDTFEPNEDARTCCEGNTYIHPATKEQRDQLEKAMADAGYTFDFEKKELKNIEPDEWSDECCRNQLIVFCENCMVQDTNAKRCANWLKSLKDRVQPKQEWSEEDIKTLNRISTILVEASEVKNWWKEYRLIERDEMIKLTDFLKSFKDRIMWKPSSEQMFDLKCAADSNSNVLLGQSLLSLYNELKKLREE